MMKKSTSSWRAALIATTTIPLFVCLLLLFGNEAIAQSKVTSNESTSLKKIKDDHFKNATIVFVQNDGIRIKKPYSKLTEEEKSRIPMPPPPPPVQKGEQGHSLAPLSDGSIVEIFENNRVVIQSGENGNFKAPKPPKPPKALKALKAPKPPKAVEAQKPPKAPKAPKPPKAIKIVAPPVPPAPPVAPTAPAPPPPPPPPVAPKDYIAKMAKSGATFMLNGKSVTKEEALEAVKDESGGFAIRTTSEDGKSIVHIKRHK